MKLERERLNQGMQEEKKERKKKKNRIENFSISAIKNIQFIIELGIMEDSPWLKEEKVKEKRKKLLRESLKK